MNPSGDSVCAVPADRPLGPGLAFQSENRAAPRFSLTAPAPARTLMQEKENPSALAPMSSPAQWVYDGLANEPSRRAYGLALSEFLDWCPPTASGVVLQGTNAATPKVSRPRWRARLAGRPLHCLSPRLLPAVPRPLPALPQPLHGPQRPSRSVENCESRFCCKDCSELHRLMNSVRLTTVSGLGLAMGGTRNELPARPYDKVLSTGQ